MKKILVTGAARFIGSNLTQKLLNENNFVVGFDNLNNYYNPVWKEENLNKFKENKNFQFKRENRLIKD